MTQHAIASEIAEIVTGFVKKTVHCAFYTFDDREEYATLMCHIRGKNGTIEVKLNSVSSTWFPLGTRKAMEVYIAACLPPLRRVVCILGEGEGFTPKSLLGRYEAYDIDLGPKTIDERSFTMMTRLESPSAAEIAWSLLQ